MKWLNPKPEPVLGQTRERFPFAWLPTQVGDYMVWLERYWIEERLSFVCESDEYGVHPAEGWVEVQRGFPQYY